MAMDQPSTIKPHLGTRVYDGIIRAGRAIQPGQRAWRGAVWGGVIALTLMLLASAVDLFGQASAVWLLPGTVLFLSAFAVAGALLTLIWATLKAIPVKYVWVLLCGFLILANMALTALSVSLGIFYVGLSAIVLFSLVGAGGAALRRGGWSRLSAIQRSLALGGLVLGSAGLIIGSVWLFDSGSPLSEGPSAAMLSDPSVSQLELPDPSLPGPLPVETLTYGSGEDRFRPEYGEEVSIITDSVDGSALVERWSNLRTAYWGFGPEDLPRNGRVWYPQGDGRFPLVMIIHGQHPMDDFSDSGYAYLGQQLASRGFIVVSVDENFLNLSPLVDLLMFQSLIEPDDLRGWLLLEHLQLWHEWQGMADSPFYGKVDLDHIALIGHSRGGQAAAVAALFNELPCYPDDASLQFDYDFNIRSVIGIAPIDGGYLPAEQDIILEDVNYLVLQGAHDMDVFTFQGDKQYSRVQFSGCDECFKSALYITGANHGQFNTVWGRKDLFEPIMRVFNLEQLMSGEEQRQIAKVTISAFLEATLRGQQAYLPFFQDLRRGQDWLPDTQYLWQYDDALTIIVSTFEEDVDLQSATLPGASLSGENLTIWREQPVPAKWQDLGNQAVLLGWDKLQSGADASYRIYLSEILLALTSDTTLVFSLADADLESSYPMDERKDERSVEFIDLTVEVVDVEGDLARLPLHHFMPLQPQIQARLGKSVFMSPFPDSEAVLQHYEFQLQDFITANSAFDPGSLAEVRLVFDRTQAGVILLDNLGFRD